MMFKIGDRVRIKGAFGIHKGEHLIEDLISESISYKLEYFSGSYSDRNLELVQTSEQIAVEKFKEELKVKLKRLLEYYGLTKETSFYDLKRKEFYEFIDDIDIWHKTGLQFKKEILKLLESD